MKYRQGDKVRVRNDLVEWMKYGRYRFVPSMSKIQGEQIVKEVIPNKGYILFGDVNEFKWSDEMFEEEMEDKMDNNTLQINMNNLSDEERATFLSLVEKANKPVNKVWKPKKGEVFYTVYADGSIYELTWLNNADRIKRYEIGNCFKTKNEAEFALEKLKVITELKRYACEYNEEKINWQSTDGKYNYYIKYDVRSHIVTYDFEKFFKREDIYFTSREIAKAAIKEIGEERLKKYYFEVED